MEHISYQETYIVHRGSYTAASSQRVKEQNASSEKEDGSFKTGLHLIGCQ